MYAKHTVSASGTVIRDDGRILAVQRRDNGAWEAPGGILELEETIPVGLTREIREETGLDVEAEALTGVYKNMKLGVVALFFRCRLLGGAETLSDETAAIRWLTRDEVTQMMTTTTAMRVLDAIAGNGPHVRAHDGIAILDKL